MSKIIAIAACTLLLGAASPPESADFVYTGTDDATGGRILMRSLGEISRSWKVEWLAEEKGAFILNRADDPNAGLKPSTIVQVKMLGQGLDRVTITAVFPGRAGNAKDLKALQFLNKLNGTITGLSFSYEEGGQVVAEAYHDFRNVIVGRDLEELFKDFDGVMDAIMENKELREEFFRFVAQENGRPNRGA
jgi:hypothetical protein